MSKKSMKQYKEKFATPKKVVKNNKRKVAEWVLAILILIWTIGTVLGVVGFVRTLPKASAEETQSTMQVKDINRAYNPVTGETEAVLPILTSAVFWSDGAPALHIGTFSIRAVGRSRYFVYNGTAYDLSQAVDRSISFQVGVRSTDYYVFTGNAMLVNTEMGAGFPSVNSFTMDSYSIRYVYPTLLDGLMFEIKINEVGVAGNTGDTYSYTFTFATDYIADEYFYTAYYGNFDSTFIPNQKLYTATGEVIANAENGSYQDGYSVGFRDGVDTGFDDGYNQGVDAGYDDGYSSGFDEGFNTGTEAGYNRGYDTGYVNGYGEGKEDGFTEGVANANEYSFAGLLGAVFDVPVQTFQGLFNFEILGVNLSGFFLALLTLMIILAITKLFI